jgi:hypothetical protein
MHSSEMFFSNLTKKSVLKAQSHVPTLKKKALNIFKQNQSF